MILAQRLTRKAMVLAPTEDTSSEAYLGPHWNFGEAWFDLEIPAAVQEDLEQGQLFERVAERLRVHLSYGWQVPISCIEIVGLPESVFEKRW